MSKDNESDINDSNNNVKNIGGQIGQSSSPISADREPLVDVNTTDKEIKVVVEMPGIKKNRYSYKSI